MQQVSSIASCGHQQRYLFLISQFLSLSLSRFFTQTSACLFCRNTTRPRCWREVWRCVWGLFSPSRRVSLIRFDRRRIRGSFCRVLPAACRLQPQPMLRLRLVQVVATIVARHLRLDTSCLPCRNYLLGPRRIVDFAKKWHRPDYNGPGVSTVSDLQPQILS